MWGLTRDPPPPAEHVLEVVTPRTNAARLSSAEHLFGTLVPGGVDTAEPVALEIVSDTEQRRFLVRTTSSASLRRVGGQLGAAYPQATLRPVGAATFPTGDALQVGPDEQVEAACLRLRAGAHLPLSTFDDRDLDSQGQSGQSDPVLAILSALSDLSAGWRAVSQLVVFGPAPPDWARGWHSSARSKRSGARTAARRRWARCKYAHRIHVPSGSAVVRRNGGEPRNLGRPFVGPCIDRRPARFAGVCVQVCTRDHPAENAQHRAGRTRTVGKRPGPGSLEFGQMLNFPSAPPARLRRRTSAQHHDSFSAVSSIANVDSWLRHAGLGKVDAPMADAGELPAHAGPGLCRRV
jgi:hypothetical protein